MEKDLYNNAKTLVAVPLVAVATDADLAGSIVIDTLGFESGTAKVLTGAVTAGNVAITAIVEGDESDVSDGTAIPAARLIGTLAGTAVTAANTVGEVGFLATKRYVKITITSDDSANLIAGGTITLSDPINSFR